MTDSFLGPNFYAFPISIKYGHLMIQTFTLYSDRTPWMVSFSRCPREEWGGLLYKSDRDARGKI